MLNKASACKIGQSWPWSYGSWIYNYLYMQSVPITRILIRARCTKLC